jgi:type IV pilus assembly protein PilB
MPINDQIRDRINRGASTEKIRDIAMQTGMVPLRESGLEKVFTGVTTIEEVIRETTADAS